MNRNFKSLKLAFALALATLGAPQRALAVGEVNGRIGGTITEAQSGAPVPGATVTITSKALPGGGRTVSTSDDGHYELVELPPGTYSVEVSYSGVKPIKRKVIVRQGELLPLDIAWSAELAEAEVTVVVEERHMTRPDTTQTGTVVTADTSAKIATDRSYQDIAQQVAGVVDVNGGGNPQIKGGNAYQNTWLIDGMNVSDAVTNTFSANLNFDSIASVEVITGGMEAQYNSLGGVINLITAGGSDEWHVNASVYLNNQKFSAGAPLGATQESEARPLQRQTAAPVQSYQAVLNLSGPILKHRLWFNLGVEYNYTEAARPAGPPLNYQSAPRTFNGVNLRLKLTYAPSQKHRVTLSVASDPAFISNTSNGNFVLPIAQTYQKQGGVMTVLQYDYFINQNLNFQLQTGFQYSQLDGGSIGAFTSPSAVDSSVLAAYSDKNRAYNPNEPQQNNLRDGTTWYQGASANFFDKRYTFQFDPSISIRGKAAGSHDAKIGLQTRFIRSTYESQPTGGGVSYDSATNGPRGEGGVCIEDPVTKVAMGAGCFQKTVQSGFSQVYQGASVGLYLQDRWKPHRRLTVMPGIRFDYGYTENQLGQAVSSLFGIGPRLGFSVDLTGDQKTIFTAFYGRANEVLNLLAAAYANPVPPITTYGLDADNRFTQVVNQIGGAGGYALDPNATTPHTDEVTLSLRREIFKDSVAGLDYTYKRVSNIWDSVEINQIWDPTGYRVIGYKNPNNPGQILLYTTPDRNVRQFQGIDLYAESRPTPHWDLYMAYSLAFAYGLGQEQFQGQVNGTFGPNYNPRQALFYQGYLPEDVRHVVRLRAAYTNKGFNVGGYMTYRSGTNATRNYYEYLPDGNYVNHRSPAGTAPDPSKPNDPRAFAEIRTPGVFNLDARVSYDFHALIKQHLIVIADFFNVFNLRTVTAVNTTDNFQYGQVTGRQQPFRFQIGLRYDY